MGLGAVYQNSAKSIYSGSNFYYFTTMRSSFVTNRLSLSKMIRTYSTSTTKPNTGFVAVFHDADKDKLNILKFIKGKSGIYMWTNKLNGKNYVGSSVDLNRRILEYYNINRLLNEKSMPINVALLKYGYQNFTFTILDICDTDNLMAREKHFFEVYSPEYNILKTPGSPSRGSGWKHTEATLENMRIAASKTFKSPEFLEKLSKGQPSGIKIEVTDMETNTSTTYHAIKAAARALNIDKRYIEHFIYLKESKPLLGRYTFRLVDLNSSASAVTSSAQARLQKTSMKVEVTDVDTKEVITYSSISSAARASNPKKTRKI